MPASFASFFPSNAPVSAEQAVLAVSPGPAALDAGSDGHVGLEGAPNALNEAPGTSGRRRVRIVDGQGSAEAPDQDDFAAAPFVPTNRRRGRGRSAGLPGVFASDGEARGAGDASHVLSQRGGGRGGGRGRGRGRGQHAERARLLQLAALADPLVRSVRPRVEPPHHQRDMDDVEDAVDVDDDDDASLSSDEDPDAENADDERRAEREPPCFIPTAWKCVGSEGVDAVVVEALGSDSGHRRADAFFVA